MRILLLIIGFLAINCESNHNKKVLVDPVDFHNINNTIDPSLRSVIENYIKKYDGRFFDKEWLYYNCYYTIDNNDTTITVWVSTIYPNVFIRKDNIKVNYSVHSMLDRKVVFMFQNELDLTDVFSVKQENTKKASIEKEKPYEGPIYDGDMYFETYKIYKVGNEYQLQKLVKAIVNFLDHQPPDSYLH